MRMCYPYRPWYGDDYDVTKDYENPMNGEGPFYTDYWKNIKELYGDKYGLETVEWKESTWAYLAKHKDTLINRFNATYAYMEIGQETEERFQHFLQVRFDEVAMKYNHLYQIYEENNVDKLGTGYTDTENYDNAKTNERAQTASNSSTSNTDISDTQSGNRNLTQESTSNTDTDTKYKDTPTGNSTALNNPTNQTIEDGNSKYNGSDVENSSSEGTTNRKDTASTNGTSSENGSETEKYTRTLIHDVHNEHMIDEINNLGEKFRIIDNEFIDEFENLFIGIMARC